MTAIHTAPATVETFQAAKITQSRIAVVHVIQNGETRLRTGKVLDVRAVGRTATPNFVTIEDELKGPRSFYVDNVRDEVRFI